jgi:hypothetical protein
MVSLRSDRLSPILLRSSIAGAKGATARLSETIVSLPVAGPRLRRFLLMHRAITFFGQLSQDCYSRDRATKFPARGA